MRGAHGRELHQRHDIPIIGGVYSPPKGRPPLLVRFPPPGVLCNPPPVSPKPDCGHPRSLFFPHRYPGFYWGPYSPPPPPEKTPPPMGLCAGAPLIEKKLCGAPPPPRPTELGPFGKKEVGPKRGAPWGCAPGGVTPGDKGIKKPPGWEWNGPKTPNQGVGGPKPKRGVPPPPQMCFGRAPSAAPPLGKVFVPPPCNQGALFLPQGTQRNPMCCFMKKKFLGPKPLGGKEPLGPNLKSKGPNLGPRKPPGLNTPAAFFLGRKPAAWPFLGGPAPPCLNAPLWGLFNWPPGAFWGGPKPLGLWGGKAHKNPPCFLKPQRGALGNGES